MKSLSQFPRATLAIAALLCYGCEQEPSQGRQDDGSRVILLLQIDDESLTVEQREQLPRIQQELISKLTKRISSLLEVEGVVEAAGQDQLTVELPAYVDIEEAKWALTTNAWITVYHARNVTTPLRTKDYDPTQYVVVDGLEIQAFERTGGLRNEVLPGTPEYERMISGWSVILEGEDISAAYAEVMPDGRTIPLFEFSEQGSQKIRGWSRRYQTQEEILAFVLDGKVLNIAPLARGVILDQGAYVDGNFDEGYVNALTRLIIAGSLPVDLKVLEESLIQE